jgi:hypothetical protein
MRLIVPVAVLVMATSVSMRADVVDDAYKDFLAGRYSQTFSTLWDYRVNHEGTLRVDFMLAVSACRMSEDFRAWGGSVLSALPNWYRPLQAGHLNDIRIQAQACPPTGITEAVARSTIEGKSDRLSLLAKRSNSGNDQPLPRVSVVIPPPSGMGVLAEGLLYLQGDYRSATVESAAACSALCGSEPKCAAMTFVVDQKRCWLKDTVPETATGAGYVSAVKQRRR